MRGGIRTGFVGPLQLFVIGLAALCGTSRAMATDGLADLGGTAELEARIAALEARIAEQLEERDRVQATMVSYLPEAHGPTGTDGCGSCRGSCGAVGRDFFNDCCRSGGYYGGAEIMWLKPFAAGLGAVFIDGASANQFLPGWRLWGGYQNCDGLGWRVNWWQWDQYSSGTSQEIFFGELTRTDLRLTFQKLDLLATQMVSFRRWDLVFSGGVTYVGNNNDVNLTNLVDPTESFGVNSHFDGWGLTTGLLAIRDIPGMPGLKLVSSVQWSGVYGNTLFAGLGDAAGERVVLEGTMANILELKIGTQYERCIGRGTTLFAGAGFEAQYWTGLGQSLIFDGFGGSDIGLVGFTVNTGIRR